MMTFIEKVNRLYQKHNHTEQFVLPENEYGELNTDSRLGENIMLLGYGGSISYGTNTPKSDVDIRGIALNSKDEILLGKDFEQVCMNDTDTTIYSLKKIIPLLSNCNPNTIELLGLKPSHYLYTSPVGQKLLDNKDMFLSKKAIYSFGGYANQQLRRLENKSHAGLSEKEITKHLFMTLDHIKLYFNDKYGFVPEFKIVDDELMIDLSSLTSYPVRDFKNFLNEVSGILNSYNEMSKRDKNAIEHDKLGKHCMHLIRLYYMCFDILEKHEINTYRSAEHNLLMDIRHGKFIRKDGTMNSAFYDLLNELDTRLNYDKAHTTLPDGPDQERINEFLIDTNAMIVHSDEIKYNLNEIIRYF